MVNVIVINIVLAGVEVLWVEKAKTLLDQCNMLKLPHHATLTWSIFNSTNRPLSLEP